jgi:uncharacterized Ntn-hydrolase superfamily protein
MVKLNTFSITARCERTGQFGVAVSTKVPAVGSLCPFAKAGVGAIATQSFVNPYIGINGLTYLAEGLSAQEVMDRVLAEDPDPEKRQVCIVDANGHSVAFTGNECDTWNGHLTGENYAVAGNMLVGEETIQAMAASFEQSTELPLAERLLQSLHAGQIAGGDKRGKQSAALYVVDEEDYPLIDLRVDEHEDPVTELQRVYEVANRELIPLMKMLPTKKNPAGQFDFELSRNLGLLQDNK